MFTGLLARTIRFGSHPLHAAKALHHPATRAWTVSCRLQVAGTRDKIRAIDARPEKQIASLQPHRRRALKHNPLSLTALSQTLRGSQSV